MENTEKIMNDVRTLTQKDIENDSKESLNKNVAVLKDELKKSNISEKDYKATKDILKEFSPQLVDDLELCKKERLSEEDIDKILKNLSIITPEEDKKDSEIIQNIESNPKNNKEGLKEAVADVNVNPITGELTQVSVPDATFEATLTDLLDDKNTANMEIDSKKIKESSLGTELTTVESEEFAKVIMRYIKGEKFSLYNAFPESVKRIVKSLSPDPSIRAVHEAAKDFIKIFVNNLKIDQSYIDFQQAINKTLSADTNVADLYAEHLKELMEDKFLSAADKLEEKCPDRAKAFRNYSKAFTDSYKMTRELEFIENHKSNLKRMINKRIKKFGKLEDEINYKYMNTKMGINNIKDAEKTLAVKLDKKYDVEDIKRFVGLYYYLTRNMSPNNIEEHTFMYFTIKNILGLNYTGESEFNKDLLSNINILLDKLREVMI